MKTVMWATVAGFIACLLFQIGSVGPIVFIAAVCGSTAAGVVPCCYRWAQQ